MKRIEVYYTDVEDIQELIKTHYDYDYEYNSEDIPGFDSYGTWLFDVSKPMRSEYERNQLVEIRKEVTTGTGGMQYMQNMLRLLVEDGHIDRAQYLIEATWG